MRLPAGTERVWAQLGSNDGRARPMAFDSRTLDSIPDPAARWLSRVLPEGVPLTDAVELSMEGEIRIGGRWMPFTARQRLRAGVGFVWQPVVGGRFVRFVGADILGPDDARMEFRLHGLVPVVRSSGPDTARSAAGRLAAETVVWVPQAVTPQAGARWRAVDAAAAVVAVETTSETVDVTVTVGGDGRLLSVQLERWNDAAEPPAAEAFGGAVTSELIGPGGVRVAGTGIVGWGYGTPAGADGEFFRYTVDSVEWVGLG